MRRADRVRRHRYRRRAGGGERGVALIVVLWVAALVTVMAGSFVFAVRGEARIASGVRDRAAAGALADAGVRRAIAGLATRDPEVRWELERVYGLELPTGSATVLVRPESARLDLNAAPAVLLRGLLRVLAEEGIVADEAAARALADAIVDWRDPDQRRQPDGAEDADYERAGLAAGAGDRPFLSVSELRRVLGMTPEIYAALEPLVTVHTRSPQIDAFSAPRRLLLAVPGFDAAAVDAWLAERDAAREALPGAQRRSRRAPPIAGLPAQGRRFLAGSGSPVYTVLALGRTTGGAVAGRRAVVRVSGNARRPFVVLEWADDGARDLEPAG